MKKLLYFLCAVLCIISLTACSVTAGDQKREADPLRGNVVIPRSFYAGYIFKPEDASVFVDRLKNDQELAAACGDEGQSIIEHFADHYDDAMSGARFYDKARNDGLGFEIGNRFDAYDLTGIDAKNVTGEELARLGELMQEVGEVETSYGIVTVWSPIE